MYRNTEQGFIQDFFLGGERLCVGKLISCGSLLGGSGGRHPQKNFEILSPLRVIFKPSESDLRPLGHFLLKILTF